MCTSNCQPQTTASNEDALADRIFHATIQTLEIFSLFLGKRLGLYETSGHWQNYRESMFPLMGDEDSGGAFCLKPMNCPHHIQIYKSEGRSYRDLPLRLSEFGTVYRYEKSGELGGLKRARGFTVDDAHLFVTPEQLFEEFRGVVELVRLALETFGLAVQ